MVESGGEAYSFLRHYCVIKSRDHNTGTGRKFITIPEVVTISVYGPGLSELLNMKLGLDEGKNNVKYKLLFHKLSKRNAILAGLLAGTIGGGLYINYGNSRLLWLAKEQKTISPEEKPQYIQISKNEVAYISQDSGTFEYGMLSWWKHQPLMNKQIHWRLLKLSESKDKHIRHLALSGLVELPGLNDAEFREIAQACNFKTSLDLAKIKGVDERFFLKPPPIPQEFCNYDLSTSLKMLLSQLPKEIEDECAKFFTSMALGIVYNEDEGGIWRIWGEKAVSEGESGVNYPKRLPKTTSILLSLQALLSQSAIQHHRVLIIKNGGLQLMQRAINDPENIGSKETLEICSLVGKIIGNLALEADLRQKIFSAGWIGILAKWFKSESNELSLIAARALNNLSAEEEDDDPILEDGIYILHPFNKQFDFGYDLDVIFVHGLLGGVFRTWRQQDSRRVPWDSKKPNPNPSTADELISAIQAKFLPSYTTCWPKDWLPKDVGRIRVLAVDYESNLSDWRSQCPQRGKMNTLESRSNDIMEKLTKAGIGKKPVVFVTHSMGGLIVKQMLLQSLNSEDLNKRNISENTKGLVFFSVPHKGSSLADLKPSVQFLVKPSVEVRELKDRNRLQEIHNSFLDLAKKRNISCLSFGETKKTNVGLKWNVLIVPPDLADPCIGKFYTLPVNHLNTCKPFDNSSPNYILLVEFLKDLIDKITSMKTQNQSSISLETERMLLTSFL